MDSYTERMERTIERWMKKWNNKRVELNEAIEDSDDELSKIQSICPHSRLSKLKCTPPASRCNLCNKVIKHGKKDK